MTNMWQQLNQYFNITIEQPSSVAASISGNSLVDRPVLQDFLAAYRPFIEGLDDTVTAAYFSSWFSSVAAALQYSMSVHNAVPNFSLSNLIVHLIPAKGYTLIGFQVVDREMNTAPEDIAARSVWRENILADFYSHTALPIMQSLSDVSTLNIGLLWGQLPTSLQNYREKFQLLLQDTAALEQYYDDDQYMRTGLNAHLFARSKNPLDVKVRKINHPLEPDTQLTIKNVCCLQYLRKDRSYCYTCPRLTKQQRAAWRP